MTNKEAIKELKEYAEYSCGSLNESFKLAIKALEIKDKLQEMVNTLESNLSSATTCSVIDLFNEYEQAKYQAHYKCLTHLKKILED